MIIIIGAAGFVGRYLVDQLIQDGFEILATGRSEKGKEYYQKMGIPYKNLDITKENDFTNLPNCNIDAVVHTAALLSIDAANWSVADYFNANAIGTYNVLRYCQNSDINKIIYTMTHSDLSKSNSIIINEDTPQRYGFTISLGSSGPYIVSKIAAMNLIQGYSEETGIQGICLRLAGMRGYGSRDTHYNCVFHQFIQKAIKSEPIEIWGEHKTVRDVLYIKDAVNAIICAIKSPKANGVYNIGTGIGLTIEDEAKTIVNVFSPPDNPSKLIYKPEIEEVRKKSYIYDISKAQRDLGYFPKYTYEEALIDYKKDMEKNQFGSLSLRSICE